MSEIKMCDFCHDNEQEDYISGVKYKCYKCIKTEICSNCNKEIKRNECGSLMYFIDKNKRTCRLVFCSDCAEKAEVQKGMLYECIKNSLDIDRNINV